MVNRNNSRETTLPPPEVSGLIEALGSTDALHREAARRKLIDGGAQIVEHLAAYVNDHRPIVRWEVLKVLLEIESPAAVALLIRMLADDNSSIRWAAAEKLAAVPATALPLLIKILAEDDYSGHFRIAAARLLARWQSENGLEELAAIRQLLFKPDCRDALRAAINGFTVANNNGSAGL